jgi:hypothetical protein
MFGMKFRTEYERMGRKDNSSREWIYGMKWKHNSIFHYCAFHFAHTRGYTKTPCWLNVELSYGRMSWANNGTFWKARGLHFSARIRFPPTWLYSSLPQNSKCERSFFGCVPNCALLAPPFCPTGSLLFFVRYIYIKKEDIFLHDVAMQSVALSFRSKKANHF